MNSEKKIAKRAVTVITAPSSSFPDFSTFSSYTNNQNKTKKDKSHHGTKTNNGIEIDFDSTVKEIRTLGSSQFTGKQKRKYEAEQYKTLTGREKKQHKVPLKIVRGIKKKAAIREKRIEEMNKEAGVVTAMTNQRKRNVKSYSEQNRKDSRIHGPAPSIGFTRNGVLSVRKDKR
jgi:hypothetical protein